MANIVINEISQNYTYNIGNNSFATVALPITSCWGPGFFDYQALGYTDKEEYLEKVSWTRYPATQAGLESFVAAYRGPASNYKLAKDYSYQMAMTLLTAGYDVLTCRICPGVSAQRYLPLPGDTGRCLLVNAKYPGTFGNNLMVRITKVSNVLYPYYNMIIYVVDASGVRTSAENLVFRTDEPDQEDSIPLVEEVESKFVDLVLTDIAVGGLSGDTESETQTELVADTDTGESGSSLKSTLQVVTSEAPTDSDLGPNPNVPAEKGTASDSDIYRMLVGGTDKLPDLVPTDGQGQPVDREATPEEVINDAYVLATARYTAMLGDDGNASTYPNFLKYSQGSTLRVLSLRDAERLRNKEWIYTQCIDVYDMLKDKLAYNPQRIISPGWDDQDYDQFGGTNNWPDNASISPLHMKLMDVAYNSRCATGLIDFPHSLPRNKVYDKSDENGVGYAQKLARAIPVTGYDPNGSLFHTHSALFGPWSQYMYVGMSKQSVASPSFLALMIQRAMLLNQALQYEWALPTSRRHNLKIGKMDYTVSKKYLDQWQKLEGVGVNVITPIPDLGTSLWGNSTLYEVPPATYQALANLSTRYLVNAIENVVYKCGIAITFRYNNNEAYSAFYAGVTPLLDTMKNVGAIDDYYVKMAADINGLDQVNANTVVGKIYLVINGVINDIIVDLIALPPGTDLDQYRA